MNLFCLGVRFSLLKITFYKLTDICGNLSEHPNTEICRSFVSVEPRFCEINKARMEASDLSTGPLLGAFTKLRKASINFVLSVSPHGTNWLPLDEFSFNLIFECFFLNIYINRKFGFHYNRGRIKCTLLENTRLF